MAPKGQKGSQEATWSPQEPEEALLGAHTGS